MPGRWFLILFLLLLPLGSTLAEQLQYTGKIRSKLSRDQESVLLFDTTRNIQLPALKLTKGFVCKTGLGTQSLIDPSQFGEGRYAHLLCNEAGEVYEIREFYPWHSIPAQWLSERIDQLQSAFSRESIFGNRQILLGLISVVLASLVCGSISSLVLSNRMAFFSDALAHLAFAGVSIGILLHLAGVFMDEGSNDSVIMVMVIFGVISGICIALVREKTGLTNDTVIGVFFASAMGLGAILLTAVGKAGVRISPEQFLFGDPLGATPSHIVYLLLLLVGCVLFLLKLYNGLTISSFNTSLARSRRISTRWFNILFVAFLAIIVNICLKVVGALLINALLILPSATAGNVSKNMRQFFWLSIVFSLTAGLGGFLLSASWIPVIGGKQYPLASGGVIVLTGTLLFFGSMVYRSLMHKPPPAPSCSTCSH